jgi:hypothetical protein
MEFSIFIGWHHQGGRNEVSNIHWLTPPTWSQWRKMGMYSRFEE